MKNRVAFVFVAVFIVCVGIIPAFSTGQGDTGGKITLIFAAYSAPADSIVQSHFQFEKIVEEKTNGAIDVDIKHSGQLGGMRDYIENLQMGSIQGANVASANYTSIDAKYGVFDLPYISKSVAHVQSVLDNGLEKILTDALEAKTGIRNVGYAVRSPRNMYNSLRPVVVADDFTGMKIRIQESPIQTRAFQLLGAIPIPLALTERYMALQTKVVDGAENSTSLIVTQKEYEVTKYLSLTEHIIQVNCVSIDSKFLKKLTPEQNKIIVDAGRESALLGSKIDNDGEADAIKKLQELGMIVNSCPDKSSFQKKVAPLFIEYRDQIGGDVIDLFLK
jgi:tripartite ATP-independent transporter DctP family solute receptor